MFQVTLCKALCISTSEKKFPKSPPAFGCQPALKSSMYMLVDTFYACFSCYFCTFFSFFPFVMEKDKKLVLTPKNDFDRQTAYETPVGWSKYTTVKKTKTIIFCIILNLLYLVDLTKFFKFKFNGF